MVEIDPVTLLAAGTVVVGIVTLVSCLRGGKKPAVHKPSAAEKEAAAPAPVPAAAPKGKKKSKSKGKSKSKASASAAAVESASDSEPAAAPAVVAPEPAAEKDEEDRVDDMMEDSFVMTQADKKAKKAKETQEQKASRLERQKQPKEVKKSGDETVFFSESTTAASSAGNRYTEYSLNQTSPAYDGWAVVEDKRKLKKKAEANSDLDDIPPLMAATTPAAPAPAAAAPSAAVLMVVEEPVTPPAPVDLVTKEMSVEARKLGLLIGQKGVTKIGLQTATGTDITMPKVEKDFTGPVVISVTGTAEGVDRAMHALNELCTKGYCNLLASPDFHEGYVEVKPKFLPDIIGKAGFCIRAIQTHTGVKVSTPSDYTKVLPSGETIVPSKVKIVLAGAKDKVAIARSLILDLCKYYYTPVTHPGLTHVEMDIDPRYYNYVIGSKGSEIKHIQANYKVTVHIPNAETAIQNLLIIGEASNLQNAQNHILRLIEKVDERAKAEAEGIALGESAKAKYAASGTAPPTSTNGAVVTDAAAPARAPRNANRGERGARQPRAEKEAPAADAATAPRVASKDPNSAAPDEEWTNEYAPRRAPINLGALLPASAKFASAPAPASPAAPVVDAAL